MKEDTSPRGWKKLAELWRMEPTEPYAVSILESVLRDGTLSLQFFQRSWWTRSWTIQEFLLGRETEYRIGRHTITEQEVRDACHIDSYSHSSPLADDSASDRFFASNKGSILIEDMLEILRPIRTLLKCRDHLRLTQDVSLAKFVFDLSRDKLCGDNLDRIYALIGVANNKIAVVPDYSLDEDFSIVSECRAVCAAAIITAALVAATRSGEKICVRYKHHLNVVNRIPSCSRVGC